MVYHMIVTLLFYTVSFHTHDLQYMIIAGYVIYICVCVCVCVCVFGIDSR